MHTEIALAHGLSLKISDTPSGGQPFATSRLQRGLLLVDAGQELAEEAVGFGVPVLKRGLQTIFPGEAALTSLHRGSSWDITALFKLNLVERFSGAGNETVENELFYAAKDFSAAAIRRLPVLGGLLTATSSRLRQMFGWETTYVDAGFSTEVEVVYSLEEGTGKITVEIDSNALPPGITEVVAMNEQGAHHFDRYLDTSGVCLRGQEIGRWDEVNAEEAWFESRSRRAAFRLGRVKGARLFRGRELVGSRLAWAGFGYSFPPSMKGLRYEMRIERLA